MSDSTYSEEIQQLQNSLATERTKVRELEEKLEDLTADNRSTGDADVVKLKRLLLLFKKKHEEVEGKCTDLREEAKALKDQQSILKAILQSTQNELKTAKNELLLAQEQLEASEKSRERLYKQMLEERETVKNRLLEAESFQRQLSALQARFDESQEQLKAAEEQTQLQKQRIDKITQLLQEKERKASELQHFEYSFKKSLEQKQELERAVEREKIACEGFYNEKQELHQALAESRQHAAQLERVIKFLRERSEEAHLENKQLKEEFQRQQETVVVLNDLESKYEEQLERNRELSEEILNIQTQFAQLKGKTVTAQQELKKRDQALVETQQIIEKMRFDKVQGEQQRQALLRDREEAQQACVVLQQELGQKNNESQILAIELDSVKQSLQEAWQEHAALQDKQEGYVHLEAALQHMQNHLDAYQTIEKDKERLEFDLEQKQAQIQSITEISEERENRLKIAQQHLARKVKDASLLAERNKELETERDTLLLTLEQQREKMAEAQTKSEFFSQHIKRLEDQMLEDSRAQETSNRKWEEKYFQMYDKYQHMEARLTESTTRIQDLEKFEEKHSQLQALLNNLSSVLGGPIGITQPVSIVKRPEFGNPPPSQDKPQDGHEEAPYKDLFEGPKSPGRIKPNFFE